MTRTSHSRGLANRLILFGATIIMAALLAAALDPAFSAVANQTAAQADTSQAQTGLSWIETLWKHKLVIATFLSMVMIIAGALVESRRVS